MMKNFVHLHVHSHYSLLDALPKIDELVSFIKESGMESAALTDYGSMYGIIEFYKKCKENGIKPILGMEAFLRGVGGGNDDEKSYHIILLAENFDGYKNLIKLSSYGHLEGFNIKPKIDTGALKEFHDGIIALSGCVGGEIPSMILQGRSRELIKETALSYKEIFGNNENGDPCFYFELQDHPDRAHQVEVNNELIKLSKETNIPVVATRDVHYMHRDDSFAQDIMTCIREGSTINDLGRKNEKDVDRSLGILEDIISRFEHVPEAVANTVKIAQRCNVNLTLNKWHFSNIDIPENKTAAEFLEEKTMEGLKKFQYDITPGIQERINLELNVINTKGYAPYFLTVADYVNHARDNNIVVTTRGSAAGSLVSYALGITTVDPIFFKLPFERFLNPYRPSAPDIDIDFADDKREEMIAYVTNKYGKDKVAQIITFGTMMARAAIRDVGRALGYPYHFCDQVAKLIPFGKQGFQMTISHALEIEPDLKKIYDTNEEAHRLLDLAQKVEGCARHTSIHAAGVVISPMPLTEFTPIQREVGGEKITTQYDMESVESAGLLKMDFLGIRNLSILGKAVEIVEKTTGKKIDIYHLPLDDKKTYGMLAKGETMGVFQLSGSGMTRYLKELKPTNIFDIMAMVALFRPGPMESIPEYIKRKHHPELIEYLDPRLEKILDKSYGVMVYQDDVLLTAIEIAGYSWEEADKFRKAMGKKIPEAMAKQKDKFLKGCKEHGRMSELKAQRLWQLIEPFAAYGFNKAHASSYAVLAYQTAYMKANFPVQYMTAVLTAESHDLDKIAAIVHECERMGIEVMPPDINESFMDFAMIQVSGNESPRIRFGLKAIKNIGEHIVDVIYKDRKKNGPYVSIEDFLERVQDKDLNKKSLESLIKCGATDSFGHDRSALLNSIENILEFTKNMSVGSTNQNSLFAGTQLETVKLKIADSAPATEEEKLTWEKELLGLYVTSHPFKQFAKILEGIVRPISSIEGESPLSWVIFGGIIDSVKKKITKNGKIMMFATISDLSGTVEVLVFPKAYETTSGLWREGNIAWFVARTPEEEGDNKLFIERGGELNMQNVHNVRRELQFLGTRFEENNMPRSERRVLIKLPNASNLDSESIKNIFKKHPGEFQVVFVINGGKKLLTPYFVSANSDMMNELGGFISRDKIEIL